MSQLVSNAFQNSSGYRQILDEAGVSVDCFSGVDDLRRLPIVDKETLFRRFPLCDVLHRRAELSRCVRVGTSGSTGLPLNVFMSKGEAFFRRVLLLFAWRRASRLTLPLTIVDVGSWVEEGDTESIVRGGVVKIIRISIALPVEQQLQYLMQHRPQVLTGYPTSLSVLADAVRSTSGMTPFLKLLATRGEILHDEMRCFLEDSFGCLVADYYNCEEVGNLAWECPADSSVLHVNTDACVLEIVDARGEPAARGVEGRVIATNLFNYTMPFIRYDLHDRGVILHQGGDPCSCGSRMPRMAVLRGRDDDFVYLPDGRKVSPRLIATAVNRAFSQLSPLDSFDRHFRRFQVVQDARDHVTIRIVPEQSSLTSDYRSVIAPAMQRIHPLMRCSIKTVESIPFEPSGKFKKVISDIDPPPLESTQQAKL